MPVKATHITEKVRDAFMFPLLSTAKSGTFCVKAFAKKFSVSDRTAWVYYTDARKAYEAITGDWNEAIRQMDSDILQTIKDSLKTPYETAADLQGEIDVLLDIIDRGYILRVIKVLGDEREIYEPIKTAQLVQLHRLVDEKRDRIAKIRGDYVQEEKEDTIQSEIKTARDMTPEERRKKIEELEKM